MEIKIEELQQLVTSLFDRMKEAVDEDILHIEDKYYWNVPKDELYNPAKDPKDLTVGQIGEELEFLLNAQKGGYQTSSDWRKLSAVLRYLGDHQNW